MCLSLPGLGLLQILILQVLVQTFPKTPVRLLLIRWNKSCFKKFVCRLPYLVVKGNWINPDVVRCHIAHIFKVILS